MGKITDVIKKEPNQITFVGFEKLNDVITIKPTNVTLIISPGSDTRTNGRVFTLQNKKSTDPELIKLIDEFCHDEYTTFLLVDNSYYQTDIQVSESDVAF